MNSGFLEKFYGTLFSPVKTFEEIKENPSLLQGVLIVILVSILAPAINAPVINNIYSLFLFALGLLGSAIGGIICWLLWAGFIEIIAAIFSQAGKYKIILTTTAYALLPWAFLAPLHLLKSAGIAGMTIAILFGLSIWLWVTILMVIAVMKTYNISFGRALILITLPLFAQIIALNWFFGFFSTLFDIIKT